ncbi:PREDICTED: uncharacterized protein LOC105559075 [Vollenhovia emeryi]|uniref:uncharacterized protein LOC105559075 n=1 Tax=Vollenhovia emeryi TaxID=411798 RepID=UPI0005F4C6F6|nr:PREDICTED: uncharacterized protein LOC105559075 [Vollenhovia emeryi]
MNSSTLVGNPNVMVAGPPPPPPPPPPVSGHLPAMKLNTAENATARRPQVVSNDYEPPAAIQNAMLTKDKKPFTYTPGMGGKLDLSQIRSPRMARRVAKNANDEGIEGPPKSAIEPKLSPAVSPPANLLIPQVAVPVFPSNVPPQPPNRMSHSPSVNRTLSNAVDKQAEPTRNIMKVDTKVVPITVTSNQSSTPESPTSPTQITLAKAPTPWMQNKTKPQEELPEWAKRTNTNKTAGNEPLEDALSPVYVQVQQSSPQSPQAKPKQEQKQYSVPQYQQTRPQQLSQQPQQQRRNADPVTPQQINSQSHHVVPIRMEDRPSVFDVKRESGHHQFKQPPTLHHQQRWGQMTPQQNQAQNQKQTQAHVTSPSRPEQSGGTTYIIPLVVEGSEKRTMPPNTENNIKIGKPARVVQQRSPDLIQQHEPGPVQSRSFRVLQKITDTDEFNDVGPEQIRKMELSEDEKILMNKFKEQVDQETYLHQEKDPRYRGAAIPSRAFRFLQNMTESNDTPVCAAPHNVQQNVQNKRQNRNSKSFEETQANLPPSEQQVPEPKKYTGSAIPSRSFRILQAMTSTENNATQENRQADYTCRTETNLPGNQQDAFFSPRPVPFWSHSEGWWGYYPVPYNAPSNKPANEADERSFPYLRYPDENACVGYEFFYPVYDENFANVAPIKVIDRDNSPGRYGYVAVICPQPGHNDVQSGVDCTNIMPNSCDYIHNRCSTVRSSPARNDSYFPQNASVDESGNTNEINHLDAQPSGTYSPKNVCESYNSDRNCPVTSMNIVDEEDSSAPDRPGGAIISNNIEKSRKTFGLHINVPNYTYVDTSDSSDSSDCSDSNDSSDTSDSISDNEHCSDSRQKYNDTTSDNTPSNSDSDSYEGYSMDPYEKPRTYPRAVATDEDCADAAHSECPINVDTIDNPSRHSQNENSRDKTLPKNRIGYSNDRSSCVTLKRDLATSVESKGCIEEGCADNQGSPCSSKMNPVGDNVSNTERRDEEKQVTDNAAPHQLSVTYEDVERLSSERLRRESKKKLEGRSNTSREVVDDPPDDTEATMVSVSLPLKFRFSVSEDNEDITTVTVGNSEIKAERSRCGYPVKNDKSDDVCVNFHVGNDTSVDFTVKRRVSDATASTRDEASLEVAVPHVDFTFKKEPTNVGETNSGEQNAETEFPVTETTGCHRINVEESNSADDCITDSESVEATRVALPVNDDGNCVQAESTCNYFGNIDGNGTADESRLATSECSWMRDPEALQVDDTNESSQKNCSIIVDNSDDRCVDPELYQKYLLSLQDSREDTDDEDSGVTSDISRMISEVDAECRENDTDSECTVSKNQKKYQRTQTHSRLFRLLNDDSNLPDCASTDPGTRKEYLSLPLKTNAFHYDDSYCSNYSSGLTSPEYSPVHEQSCRKFHDAATSGNAASLPDVKLHRLAHQPEIPTKDNSYLPPWKGAKLPNLHEHDVIPSLAFKFLNSKMPFWTYKVNVLCPRIKSTKSVPQALLARQIDKN